MRCLGIDYGARRIGLSFGDELGVATPLPALTQGDEPRRLMALAAVIKERRITDIVIGYPLNMDGTRGFKAREVDEFSKRLQQTFALPVHRVDERLTSEETVSTIPRARRREVRASGVVDSRAATLILQDYLNGRLGLPPPPEAA